MMWFEFNFPNSNSPLMEQLIFFHDHSMLVLILITSLVSYIMMSMSFTKYVNYFLLSGQTIEIIWTIVPAIILLFVAFPSLKLLYLLEESNNPLFSIKTIGHQWYWKYEYSEINLEFDSYMISKMEMNPNNFRLLDTDNRVIIPYNYYIRVMVTAADVLHSWTIPSLGVKVDAVPGRLNQINLMTNRSSIFFGQCSELCGANHSFMPITLESISLKHFLKWMLNNKN